MWHRQGKVSLTKGSDVVTGVGTNWVENIRVGDAFQGPDGKLYQVINVASNEALAISPAYEGATATNLNYWVVPIPGYSKIQADRLSLIISKLDGDIVTATEAADRAQAAAQQAQQWRNEAAVSAAAALQSEQSAALSADIAEQARDDAVAVVTGGTASIDPEAGKIPIAGSEASIKQAWIENLQFELDALRVAKNKALYGDGPYPVIDLQFQGAKYLDPRVQFSRASVDWDEYGNEYGINEPVITDDGLWASSERTNLFLQSIVLLKNPWRSLGSVRRLEGLKSPAGADVFSLDRSEQGSNYIYQPASPLPGRSYVLSCFVKFETGEEEYRLFMGSTGFQDYGLATFKQGSNGEMIVTGSGRYKSLGAGWYRVWRSAVGAEVISGNPVQVHAYPVETEIDNYISAPQFEEGMAPTNPIPTGESQVTVARTRAEVPSSILAPSSAGGTFFASGIIPRFSNFNTMIGIGSSNSEEFRIGYSSSTHIGAVFKSGGLERSASIPVESVGVGEVIKVAFSYNSSFDGEVKLRTCINGELKNVITLPALPNGFPNLGMAIGARRLNSDLLYWGEKIFGVSYFDKSLSDGQLINLTARESN